MFASPGDHGARSESVLATYLERYSVDALRDIAAHAVRHASGGPTRDGAGALVRFLEHRLEQVLLADPARPIGPLSRGDLELLRDLGRLYQGTLSGPQTSHAFAARLASIAVE